jgi:hypothetical protein
MFNINNLKTTEIINDPWPHQLIDNFFNEDDFSEVCVGAEKLLKECLTDFPRYGDKGISLTQAKDIIGKNAYDIIFNSNEIILDNLKSLFDLYPNARIFDRYISTPSFHIMPPGSTHGIHDESYDKSMSIVVYLYPHSSIGTALYKTKNEDSLVKEIEWKLNRALIFCGETEKTWHNFYTNEFPRVTLNYFFRHSILDTIEENLDNFTFILLNGEKKIIPKNKFTLIDKELIMQGKMVRNLNE